MSDVAGTRALNELLHPHRIRTSGKFTAILAYILRETWTTPAITDLVVTSDGILLAGNEDDPFDNEIIGGISDLWRNLRGVAKAAGLTKAETGWLLAAAQIRVRRA